jgi:hypothetical protein
MADGASIELSKDGMKISYRRYLSDSAPGFILLLLVAFAHYRHVSIFGLRTFEPMPTAIGTEVKLAILFLLFLLATPLGLVINVVSWVTLEWLQKLLEYTLLGQRFFSGFKREYQFVWTDKRVNWFQVVRSSEMELLRNDPDSSAQIEPLRGSAILLRSLSWLAFAVSAAMVNASFNLKQILVSVGLGAGFIIVSACVSFYFHVLIRFLNAQPKNIDLSNAAQQLENITAELSKLVAESQKAAKTLTATAAK